jgi:hypothetical protein
LPQLGAAEITARSNDLYLISHLVAFHACNLLGYKTAFTRDALFRKTAGNLEPQGVIVTAENAFRFVSERPLQQPMTGGSCRDRVTY